MPLPRSTYLRRRAVFLVGLAALVVAVVLLVRGCGGDGSAGADAEVGAVGSASDPLRPAVASRFDDYDQPLACGGVLGRDQQGVAHKTLPCGTDVRIVYRGRTVTVPVIDRGPYVDGREFDLAGATADTLGFGGVHEVMVAP